MLRVLLTPYCCLKYTYWKTVICVVIHMHNSHKKQIYENIHLLFSSKNIFVGITFLILFKEHFCGHKCSWFSLKNIFGGIHNYDFPFKEHFLGNKYSWNSLQKTILGINNCDFFPRICLWSLKFVDLSSYINVYKFLYSCTYI